MLSTAAKIGISETGFVSTSDTENFKIDFFNQNSRIAHCGHATFATFSYHAELRQVKDGKKLNEVADDPRKISIINGAA